MSDAPTLRVGSLFSGVGGFDLGHERAGHHVAFQCEIDPFRRRVLAKHFPGVPIYEDVRSLGRQGTLGVEADGGLRRPQPDRGRGADAGSESDERQDPVSGGIDLLCGGFPCQDLSVAGARAGLEGDRSGLFYEFMRLSDELVRPGGFVLIENVPGLFSSNGGRDFAIVLASLADLGFHDLAWRVLDSRYFGVPQRRRRVFILGRRASGSLCREVLLESDGGGGHPAPSWAAGPRASRASEDGAHAPGVAAPLTRGSAAGEGVSVPGRRQEDDHNLVAGPLTKRYGKGINTTIDDGAVVVEKPIGEQIDDGEAVQALTTRFGNTGVDYPDAEAGWILDDSVRDVGTLQASPNGYRSDADSAAAGHLIAEAGVHEEARGDDPGGLRDVGGSGGGEDAGGRGTGAHVGSGGSGGDGASERGEEADADRVRETPIVPRRLDDPERRRVTEDDPLAFNWQEDDQAANWRERDYSPPLTVKSDHFGAIAVKEGRVTSIRTAQTSSNGCGIREDETGALDSSGPPAVAYSVSQGEARKQDVAPTLAAGSGPNRHGTGAWSTTQFTALVDDNGEGLDVPHDPKPDGPRYAAMGDAITVNVAEWIGLRLAHVLSAELAASLSE